MLGPFRKAEDMIQYKTYIKALGIGLSGAESLKIHPDK